MRMFMKMIWVVSALLLVGCGGGSTPTNSVSGEDSNTEIYKNSILPEIKNDTIPDALLDKTNKETLKNSKVLFKETNISNGFINLKERMDYFYFKQMEMNINLSYLDSVWTQIESYCESKTICEIPENKIMFTYTSALYNHDIELIKIYENKSGDTQSFNDIKSSLKEQIGQEALLGRSTLTTLNDDVFKYELKADISNLSLSGDNLRSITRWNEKKTLYQTREELIDGWNGDQGICSDRTSSVIYSGFDYNETVESIKSSYEYGYNANCISTSYTSEGDIKSSLVQKHNRKFDLLELADKIKLNEHIHDEIIDDSYNIPLDFYLEGEINDDGGYVISTDSEGYYKNETFDSEGNIITVINCTSGDNTDKNNLEECSIEGAEAIKNIITKNVYSVGPFLKVPDVNVMQDHSVVMFNEDNTLDAIVNCSNFRAKYTIDNKGIWFSQIQEDSNSSLTCLNSQLESNFNDFLHNGFSFGESGYVVWNGMMAELETIGEKTEFDKQDFIDKLTENRYVDSITMNHIFNVKSWDGLFYNPLENKEYFLGSSPSMKIENDKIYIDLIDASFEADIQVIDNDNVKFKNVKRINKNTVVYPSRNCTDESGPNECTDGYDASKQFDDNIFAQVVEDFLNNGIQVSNEGVPDNNSLWFHNDTLSFHAYYE